MPDRMKRLPIIVPVSGLPAGQHLEWMIDARVGYEFGKIPTSDDLVALVTARDTVRSSETTIDSTGCFPEIVRAMSTARTIRAELLDRNGSDNPILALNPMLRALILARKLTQDWTSPQSAKTMRMLRDVMDDPEIVRIVEGVDL